jgi:ESS family glutamate:Na+ symporter
MSLNVSLVVFTYLAAYLILIGITKLLSLLGSPGVQLSTNLWGIMFIFSAMTALLVKTILISLKIDHIIDNARMTRVIGFSVDFMVAAAIAAISIAVVASYWLPIVIIAVVVGAITFLTHLWLSSRIFQNHVFFRMILVFGVATGTLPTGLALLRVIDPEFETPASSDYTFASGLSFLAVIPILLTANMPAKGAMNGSLTSTWIVLGIYAAYLVVLFVLYLILSGRRRFKDPSAVWLRRK